MNALQKMDIWENDEYIILILEAVERSLDRFLDSF
jgi:hypothetical protein